MFLDRDGVLNRAIVRDGKPYPPASPEELEIMPDADKACRDLRNAGFLLIMVTNQPDVARGSQKREVVEAINRILADRLCLDSVKVCYHDDADNCKCRKPEPGLLQEAAQESKIALSESFMVGDRWRDVEAGRRAGCTTVLVQSGYSERRFDNFDREVISLTAAVDWILHETSSL